MFLPEYLEKGFDSAILGGRPLVAEKTALLHAGSLQKADTWFTPMALFITLLLAGLALSFARGRVAARILRIFDISLYLVTGLMGMVMCALWIARVDNVCRNNWNVIWALPTHAIVVFVMNRPRQWLRLYWMITAVLLALLLVCWKWLPQELNNALLPFVALLLVRSIARLKK
jgi:hypothetical protein